MMRLFIGLGLPNNARDALFSDASALGVRGRMTRRENYHVTLAFLGEHDEKCKPVEDVITAAAQTCAPLELAITGFGFFGRRDNALLYAKLRDSRPLQTLAETLRTLLSDAGEPFDGKPFSAHITLMRKADLTAANLRTPPPIAFTADRLTLYHSARVQDVLRYRPIFEAALK